MIVGVGGAKSQEDVDGDGDSYISYPVSFGTLRFSSLS